MTFTSKQLKMAEKLPSSFLDSKCLPDNLAILNGVLCSNGNGPPELERLENNNNRVLHRHRHLSLEEDESFVHINAWHTDVGGNPCSKTETIYLYASRSEEPVVSNMDISTGHIILVSHPWTNIQSNTCRYHYENHDKWQYTGKYFRIIIWHHKIIDIKALDL